jgi:hypothetical protein
MTERKSSAKKGFLPKLRGLMEALGDRYQRVLHVIDEALDSDNLKDRIWAVDWILKRSPAPESLAESPGKKTRKAPDPAELDRLSDAELLARIRRMLGDTDGGDA